MRFISKCIEALTGNVNRVIREANESLEISNNLTAFRVKGEVVVVDASKNKIIEKMSDKFPSNPARAARAIQKKLKIVTSSNKKAVWTCGFREASDRWVWYKDSIPIMTASLHDVYPILDDKKKIDFRSASFGNRVITSITDSSLEKVSKKINADVLENSYVAMKCGSCDGVENYTIDDLVDESRRADYESSFVVCASCNDLIKFS